MTQYKGETRITAEHRDKYQSEEWDFDRHCLENLVFKMIKEFDTEKLCKIFGLSITDFRTEENQRIIKTPQTFSGADKDSEKKFWILKELERDNQILYSLSLTL